MKYGCIKHGLRSRCRCFLRFCILKLIKIYHAMAIRKRFELEQKFKNGCLPAEEDFKDLIHSMLNRKDDRFFGRWQQGMQYCPGDVVLCRKSLYIASGTLEELECKPVGAERPEAGPSNCFCSQDPPYEDKAHWSHLTLEMEDGDWEVKLGEPGKGDDIMYAKVWGKIGMGTESPKARVDITVKEKGSFLFDPGDKNAPEFVIQDATCAEEDPEVRQSVNKGEAYWYINVPGYAFRKLPKPHEGNETDPDCPVHPELLMFITSDDREQPAVGIGTQHPAAALEARENGTGRILLRPGGNENPELIVINTATGDENFFKIVTERDKTVFRSEKGKGIFFRQLLENTGPLDECGEEAPLLAINQKMDDEGNLETVVGIGTDNPQTQLEVTDGESGRIHLSMMRTNPAIAIVNMRPKANQENYMTLGVNNKRGVFVTDSPNGFEFRQGSPCGKNDNELNIDQNGKVLLSIDNDAKLGVGKHPSHLYELDVNGELKSFGAYLETHRDSMEDAQRLDGKESLDKLRRIHPVSFNWKADTWRGKGSSARQIGLFGHEVADVFEELVKNLDDGNHAVAYQNMVAVLISAVNELSKEVKDLKEKLAHR